MIPLNASDRWYIITLLSLFHPLTTLPPPRLLSFFFFPSLHLPPSSCHCNRQHFLELVIIYSVSLFISFFFFFFKWLHNSINFLWGWMCPEFVVIKWSDHRQHFWERATQSKAKGHRSAKNENCFPIIPPCSPFRQARASFNTAESSILLIETVSEKSSWLCDTSKFKCSIRNACLCCVCLAFF